MTKTREKPSDKVWADFKEQENLTDEQLEKFQKYAKMLMQWNKDINLTAITNLSGIVRQHFCDSIALRKFVDFKTIKSIADVGSGAGFPGIPLKILFPNLKVYLIEVTKKKQSFLEAIIDGLDLEDIEVVDLDWRTFLRNTDLNIDMFITRAAFDDYELCRMFRANCAYKDSKLVYWGTSNWEPHKKNEKYLKDVKEYKVGKKDRKFFFLEK